MDNRLLVDKRLLMLGGASYTPYVKEYTDKNRIHLLAAGNTANSAMIDYVEEFFIAEASDVDAMVSLVKEKRIDGIIALGNEDIIDCVVKVAEKCDIPFYINQNNWDNLQNKAAFKKHCKEFDIDVVEEFCVTENSSEEELSKLPLPVVLKPADSCGSKGVTICNSVDEIKQAMNKAKGISRTNSFLAEQYMQCPEFIVSYIIVDGNVYIWMLGDRHMNTQQKGFGGLSNLSLFPSRYAKLYIDTVHPKMLKMLKKYGPKNGSLFIQGFIDEGKIRFFDPGLRFCGTLDIILYEPVCGINPLHWMINHSLTGIMCDMQDAEKMDWKLHGKIGAQLSVLLNPGQIASITGLDSVSKMDEVIKVTQLLEENDTINMVGTLQQVFVRVHFAVGSKQDVLDVVNKIYETISVTDCDGNDMKMPFVLDFAI